MPSQYTEYKVFVASPSDTELERSASKRVAEELNLTTFYSRNIKIEVIGWENHTYPGVGEDAQDVINKQITDYDIFLGIMWSKFGSPTKRDESGTKEEFEIAFSKYQENPDLSHILFFFKTEPIPYEQIDGNNIEKVKNFKKQLSDRGVLYKEFNTINDFERFLRMALTNVINKIEHNLNNNLINKDLKNQNIQSNNEIIATEDEDENGYFELIEIVIEEAVTITNILSKATDYATALSVNIDRSVKKFDQLPNLDPNLKMKEMKRILDVVADTISSFSRKINDELPNFNKHKNNLIENLKNILKIHKDIVSRDDYNTIINDILKLKDDINESNVSIIALRNTIESSPSYTKNYIRSKREATKVLNQFINDQDNFARALNALSGDGTVGVVYA